MRRAHRKNHWRLWPTLLVIVGLLFALALALRAPPAPAAPVVSSLQEHAR